MDQTSKTVPVTSPPPLPSSSPATSPPAAQPAQPKSGKPSVAELEIAHARAHKRLTIIEIIGVRLLVFFALASLAGWAYYQQTSQTHTEPYSTNVYQ